MKKENQKVVNELCNKAYGEVIDYIDRNVYNILKEYRLFNCQAKVVVYPDYICLYSYQTMVAFIDLNNDTCYDILRLVYGYTATSAKHIAKFYHKFSKELSVQPSLLRYYDR